MSYWPRTPLEIFWARICSIWLAVSLSTFKLLAFPIYYYLLSVRSRQNDDRAHHLNRIWAKTILMICGIRVIVHGRHHLKPGQTYIFVPNHNSYLDIPVCYLAFPGSFRFIGKKELNKVPLFGWMYERLYITVNRASRMDSYRSLTRAAEKLREEISMVIFPEGTIAANKKVLSPFKEGAFRLAIETKTPIIPVSLIFTDRVLPENQNFKVYPGKIVVLIHEPISTEALLDSDALDLKNKVHHLIFDTLAPYYNHEDYRRTH